MYPLTEKKISKLTRDGQLALTLQESRVGVDELLRLATQTH
jgi:hypothetical protein